MASDNGIAKRFGKQRLLDIAEELDIEVSGSTRVLDLVQIIREDLDANGIPDGDVTEDLFDLLVAMDYIDEDGAILGEDDDEQEEPEGGDPEDEPEPLPETLPECFGWGDAEHDPSCSICSLAGPCMAQCRQNIADMPCYGQHYDAEAKECQSCVLWRMCQEAMG